MEIKLVIRTCKRIDTIEKHTLKLIENLSYKTYIFCPKDEIPLYWNKFGDKYTYIDGGNEGTHICNLKILEYFDDGEKIVQFDDDVIEFVQWNNINKFEDADLNYYINEGFKLCDENNFKLFGFYPVKNGYFMQNLKEISYGLQFIMGGIHGFINDKLLKTYDNCRDDYERTILNYLKFGGCIRFNKVKANNIIYKNEGGHAKKRDLINMQESVDYMINNYPEYCRIKKCKSKYPEISIINKPPIL